MVEDSFKRSADCVDVERRMNNSRQNKLPEFIMYLSKTHDFEMKKL